MEIVQENDTATNVENLRRKFCKTSLLIWRYSTGTAGTLFQNETTMSKKSAVCHTAVGILKSTSWVRLVTFLLF